MKLPILHFSGTFQPNVLAHKARYGTNIPQWFEYGGRLCPNDEGALQFMMTVGDYLIITWCAGEEGTFNRYGSYGELSSAHEFDNLTASVFNAAFFKQAVGESFGPIALRDLSSATPARKSLAKAIMVSGWMLVHDATLQPAKQGDALLGFNGEVATLNGGQPPDEVHAPTGRIYITDEDGVNTSFSPANYYLKWVKIS